MFQKHSILDFNANFPSWSFFLLLKACVTVGKISYIAIGTQMLIKNIKKKSTVVHKLLISKLHTSTLICL